MGKTSLAERGGSEEAATHWAWDLHPLCLLALWGAQALPCRLCGFLSAQGDEMTRLCARETGCGIPDLSP